MISSVRTAESIPSVDDMELPQPIRAASARQTRASLLRQSFVQKPNLGQRANSLANLENLPSGRGCRDSKACRFGFGFIVGASSRWVVVQKWPQTAQSARTTSQAHTHKGKFLRGSLTGQLSSFQSSSLARANSFAVITFADALRDPRLRISTNPASDRGLCGSESSHFSYL